MAERRSKVLVEFVPNRRRRRGGGGAFGDQRWAVNNIPEFHRGPTSLASRLAGWRAVAILRRVGLFSDLSRVATAESPVFNIRWAGQPVRAN